MQYPEIEAVWLWSHSRGSDDGATIICFGKLHSRAAQLRCCLRSATRLCTESTCSGEPWRGSRRN